MGFLKDGLYETINDVLAELDDITAENDTNIN